MIKHLVISGGATSGFAFFGVMKELIAQNIFTIDNIESFYATSIGTFMAVLFSLKYTVEELEMFLMDRPWNHVFKIDFNTMLYAMKEGGMFQREQIEQSFRPVLLGKELSMDITLEEFYEVTKKEIHFYTTEYNKLELCDISYKTHPQWYLIDAIYASCCLPILFKPCLLKGHYYIDGAILLNYPLLKCLEKNEPDTILGIYRESKKENATTSSPYVDSSPYKLTDYLISLIFKIWTVLKKQQFGSLNESLVNQQIAVDCPNDPLAIMKAFESKEERLRLMEIGVETVKHYHESTILYN